MKYDTVCRIPGRNGLYFAKYENGILTKLRPCTDPTEADSSVWLTPGLFDIQVNGMLGHNLSSDDLTSGNRGGFGKARSHKMVSDDNDHLCGCG